MLTLFTFTDILHYEGAGHTFSIHTENDKLVDYFAARVPASRIIVNCPSSLGGIGATTGLMPSLTLGCGAVGGSATSDNVGPMNLLNIRRVAYGLKEADDIRKEAEEVTGECFEKTVNGTSVNIDENFVDDIVNAVIRQIQGNVN